MKSNGSGCNPTARGYRFGRIVVLCCVVVLPIALGVLGVRAHQPPSSGSIIDRSFVVGHYESRPYWFNFGTFKYPCWILMPNDVWCPDEHWLCVLQEAERRWFVVEPAVFESAKIGWRWCGDHAEPPDVERK